MPDARTTIGALVTARATLVTHISECRRRFAGDLSTRRVVGVVLGVEHRRNPETGRAQRYVNAQYDLGEGFGIKLSILAISLFMFPLRRRKMMEMSKHQLATPQSRQIGTCSMAMAAMIMRPMVETNMVHAKISLGRSICKRPTYSARLWRRRMT
jgi:hypothetical protein